MPYLVTNSYVPTLGVYREEGRDAHVELRPSLATVHALRDGAVDFETIKTLGVRPPGVSLPAADPGTTPVSRHVPEIHAKPLALSYAFDVLRVPPQYREGMSMPFCSESSQRGMLWTIDTGTSSGTHVALDNHGFRSPKAPCQNHSFSVPTTAEREHLYACDAHPSTLLSSRVRVF